MCAKRFGVVTHWHLGLRRLWLRATTQEAPHERAQQRFCSFSKPLARCALDLPELIQTVNRIAAGGGASWAKSWLRGLTCTKLLLLGMTADLAQDAIELTRFFDVEGLDIAQINEKVYLLSQQVDVLFDQSQCFQLHTFTKHCVDLLESKQIALFYDSQARTLGASQLNSAKRSALTEMQACASLCRKTIMAEFPTFDALMAFKIFTHCLLSLRVEGKKT